MVRARPWARCAAATLLLTASACSRTPLDLFRDASAAGNGFDASVGPDAGSGGGDLDGAIVTRDGGAADGGGARQDAELDASGVSDASLDASLDASFDAGSDAGCDPTTDPTGCTPGGFTSLVLSGNQSTTCFINADGALYCWGADYLNAAVPASRPAPVRIGTDRYRSVSAGTGHACAIREDGNLFCWGRNCAGQLGGGASGAQATPIQVGTASHWKSVAVGGGYSWAIDDTGALSYWGNDADTEGGSCNASHMKAPTNLGGTWRQVSSHKSGAYGLKQDGTLWRLWSAAFGEAAPASAQRMGTSTWRVISAGVDELCGIRDDGSLACAEEPPATLGSFQEERIGLDSDWGDAIAVAYDACAIKQDHSLWCWAGPSGARKGNARFWGSSKQPVRAGTDSAWSAVSQGEFGGCGISDKQVVCWGDNHAGELGIGVATYQPAPTLVSGETSGWSKPRTSGDSSCAFRGTDLYCWGSAATGLLGFESDRMDKQHPAQHVMESWLDAQLGAFVACAISSTQDLKCWGDQLGTTAQAGYSLGSKISSVGRGRRNCVIDVRDVGFCWPSSYDAGGVYIGQPAPSISYLPKSITFAKFRSLTSSDYHTCGITTAGALWCWGGNANGELGRGTRSAYESTATAVAGGGSWLDVSTSLSNDGTHAAYTCAVSDDGGQGRLFCWGSGSQGRLGGGNSADVLSPQQVGTRSSWVRVATGPRRACALTSSGELWCWGANDDGALGIGSADGALHTPERVGASSLWVDVSLSDDHACAVTSVGALSCWGIDRSGELGNDSAWRAAPTPLAL